MAKNLIIYYSRKGQNYVNGSIRELSKGVTVGRGLAVHGADAARSEATVAAWAKKSV